MATIEIDFEVYKALTAQRQTEGDTYNDVLRRVLRLEAAASQAGAPPNAPAYVYKGVTFPEGTRFRATYKGTTHTAEIKNGAWTDQSGRTHTSPSAAAGAISSTSVNGWAFWECNMPGTTAWRPLKSLRS